jgi:hypothetical protein
MKAISILIFSVLVVLSPGCQQDSAQKITATSGVDQISIQINGTEFTSYIYGADGKYPYFYPINGPLSGKSITSRNQEPYPHQSSIYFGLDHVVSENVERGNYWQAFRDLETGQVFSRNPEILVNDGNRVVISDDLEWIVPATGTRHFREKRTTTIWAPSSTVRIMDFDIEMNVLKDLFIRPTGHAFFSARVSPAIAVGCPDHGPEWAHLGTGTIVDSEGNVDEKETREKSSVWAAYYGNNEGNTEGLAILQHPGNAFYPGQWVTRNYGFISPSPFTFNTEPVEMKEGQSFSFKYRLVVFAGDHQQADIDRWYNDFVSL